MCVSEGLAPHAGAADHRKPLPLPASQCSTRKQQVEIQGLRETTDIKVLSRYKAWIFIFIFYRPNPFVPSPPNRCRLPRKALVPLLPPLNES